MNLRLVLRMLRFGAVWATGISLLCACTNTPVSDGGGSRGGNPVVVGTIASPDGSRARNVRVLLIAQDYNPLTDTLQRSITTSTTDSLGTFSIIAPDTGWYNIEAIGSVSSTRLVRFKVKTLRDSVSVLPLDTLHKTGTIKVALSKAIDLINSYAYVPGTTIANWNVEAGDTITIDTVPAGILPVLCLGNKNSTEKIVIRYDVSVISNTTTVVHNWEWSYNRQIILNTSVSGAGIKENVYDFPVIVRLTSENFDFPQAQKSGGDIRFTTLRGTPLFHEIEQWDGVNQRAAIWVKVDTVFGNNNLQSIMMYWGNPGVTDASNSASVFDTTAGYQGVWHFGDTAGSTVRDATVNGFTGTSPDTARPLETEGVAGMGRLLDGANDYITMPNTAGSKLNFPENGNFTISAWASIDTFDGVPHVVIAKGYDQYFIRSTGTSNAPLWNFAQLGADNNWQACTTSAANRKWTFVTGVRQGNRQLIYCNGALVDSIPNSFASASFSRNMSSDISIGGYLKAPNSTDSYCFFKGSIDEIRMISTAQSSDWVLLCYMNQRLDDRLVVFK
jgi:hypothetical protein